MQAFVGTEMTKAELLARLEAHAAADEIVQGRYWEGGKGCAVGCSIHDSDHSRYESAFGIPQMLARLEDQIFEGLPNEEAKAWPLQFVEAIPEGADLSLVGPRFLHWLIAEECMPHADGHTRTAMERVVAMLAAWADTGKVDAAVAAEAAEAARAARAVWAARAAADAARAAWAASADMVTAYRRYRDKLLALLQAA